MAGCTARHVPSHAHPGGAVGFGPNCKKLRHTKNGQVPSRWTLWILKACRPPTPNPVPPLGPLPPPALCPGEGALEKKSLLISQRIWRITSVTVRLHAGCDMRGSGSGLGVPFIAITFSASSMGGGDGLGLEKGCWLTGLDPPPPAGMGSDLRRPAGEWHWTPSLMKAG